jgi:hypothetical protein
MNMTAETIESEVVEKEYILKATDRCDSCNAQAYVVVKGVGGELMFCAHHYKKNEIKLKEYAFEIIDERDKLTKNKIVGDARA